MGEDRFKKKIPPGYADMKEKQNEAKYGDWIVWKQVLDKATKDKQNIIFVTGDEKEDWFISQKGKIISPRPELMQEFSMLTNQNLYIYTTDKFLKYANDYLHSDIQAVIIEEVKNTQKEASQEKNQNEKIDDTSDSKNYKIDSEDSVDLSEDELQNS